MTEDERIDWYEVGSKSKAYGLLCDPPRYAGEEERNAYIAGYDGEERPDQDQGLEAIRERRAETRRQSLFDQVEEQ